MLPLPWFEAAVSHVSLQGVLVAALAVLVCGAMSRKLGSSNGSSSKVAGGARGGVPFVALNYQQFIARTHEYVAELHTAHGTSFFAEMPGKLLPVFFTCDPGLTAAVLKRSKLYVRN